MKYISVYALILLCLTGCGYAELMACTMSMVMSGNMCFRLFLTVQQKDGEIIFQIKTKHKYAGLASRDGVKVWCQVKDNPQEYFSDKNLVWHIAPDKDDIILPDSIKYAVVPSGFTEKTPAVPLVQGKICHFRINMDIEQFIVSN